MAATDLKQAPKERTRSRPVELPTSAPARLRRVGTVSLRGGWSALVAKIPGGGQRGRDGTALSKSAATLGELKGLPMKVGQFLGYASDSLHGDARAALWALQTDAPPLPFAHIRAVLHEQLGPGAAALLAELDPEPVAVASIGQVHKARLPDGTAVAVKVQYPGIEKAIARDFEPAALGARFTSLFNRGAKRGALVRQVRERVLTECDYLDEARRQALFAQQFARHPVVTIPPVHSEYSADRVLTTTWAQGVDLCQYLAAGPSAEERDRMGAALFDFYVGSMFMYGHYNCDPHPGNCLFAADGAIAILDHGCGHAFDTGFVTKLFALSCAVENDEPESIRRALVELGVLTGGQRYDYALARDFLRWLYGPMIRDEVTTFERDAASAARAWLKSKPLRKLALPGEFIFLLRLRVGLAAVLAQLGARANWCSYRRGYPTSWALRPPEFDVVLVDPGLRTIEVIREIREALGIGVREAKELVDGVPRRVKQALQREEAEALQARLQAVGSRVEIRKSM